MAGGVLSTPHLDDSCPGLQLAISCAFFFPRATCTGRSHVGVGVGDARGRREVGQEGEREGKRREKMPEDGWCEGRVEPCCKEE